MSPLYFVPHILNRGNDFIIVVALRDTVHPVGVEKACSASSWRGKSVDQPLNPYLAGVPYGPSGSQGLGASSWHGSEHQDSWDL